MALDQISLNNDQKESPSKDVDISSLLIKLLGSNYINNGKTKEYTMNLMNEVRSCKDIEMLRNIANKLNLLAYGKSLGYLDLSRFMKISDPEILQNLIMHLGDKIVRGYQTPFISRTPFES